MLNNFSGVTNDEDAFDELIMEKDTEKSTNVSNICDVSNSIIPFIHRPVLKSNAYFCSRIQTIESERQSPEIHELPE